MLIRFFVRAVPDTEASAREGRTIFRNSHWYEITWTTSNQRAEVREGEVTSEVLKQWREARPENGAPSQKNQWAVMFEQWRADLETPVVGTPLAMVPFLTPADVENLASMNIRSLETLAATPDLPPEFERLSRYARDFLASADTGKGAAELEAMRVRAETAEMRVMELEDELGVLRAQTEGKRGKAAA